MESVQVDVRRGERRRRHPARRALAAQVRERRLPVDGETRRFLLARPDGVNAPLPLVIEFHGSGHFAEGQMAASDFVSIAAREHFAVAAPEAMLPVRVRPEWPEGRAWNVPGVPLTSGESPDGPDEVAFVSALIAALVAEGIADEQCVYLAGFSGGARLCSHLAGVMPERIAAIGAVAGLRLPPLSPVGPPPIIAFHSRADEINPFAGGAGARWDMGVAETEAAYARWYHWDGPAIDVTNGMTRHVYRDRDACERLISYTLEERPHGWYGSRDPQHAAQYGTAADSIDATTMIWEFFRRNRR